MAYTIALTAPSNARLPASEQRNVQSIANSSWLMSNQARSRLSLRGLKLSRHLGNLHGYRGCGAVPPIRSVLSFQKFRAKHAAAPGGNRKRDRAGKRPADRFPGRAFEGAMLELKGPRNSRGLKEELVLRAGRNSEKVREIRRD
jgi:hypothetical protein